MRADTNMRSIVVWVVAVLLGLSVAAGCSGGGDDDATDDTGFVAKPTISLVVNDWTASAINTAIAEQLIERHLGYPVVPTRLNSSSEIYEGLTDGAVDAVLEVWPSTSTERDRGYLDRGDVLDLGPLGPTGKVGWFVPRYVIDEHPELATWEGFDDPAVVEMFATPETAPNGQFLGTNPSYAQFDEQIIGNLGLPLTVVYSGSEKATMGAFATATDAGEPILAYWWTPTAAVGQYDLVNVALPEPTAACAEAANTDGGVDVDCDYPEDELFKVASPALEEKAPDVMRFLEAFTLTTDDQLALLVTVEGEGRTVNQAAADWIVANEATWRPWLEPVEVEE